MKEKHTLHKTGKTFPEKMEEHLKEKKHAIGNLLLRNLMRTNRRLLKSTDATNIVLF